jgi:hypothetical protein
MLSKFLALFDIFQKGRMLKNPEVYKNVHRFVQVLVAAAIPTYHYAVLQGWVPDAFSDTNVSIIATAVAGFMWVALNEFFIVGTTKKVGTGEKVKKVLGALFDMIITIGTTLRISKANEVSPPVEPDAQYGVPTVDSDNGKVSAPRDKSSKADDGSVERDIF